MSEEEYNEPLWLVVIKGAGALIAIAAALGVTAIIAVFVWGVCVGMWNGLQREFTITSEEQSKIDKDNEAWSKDARNPKVAGQACIDRGGVPRYSNWDGEVFECNIIGEKK